MVIVFNPAGQLLLVRQSYREAFTLPGGFLERKESAVAAAVREMGEETRYRPPIEDLEFIATYIQPNGAHIEHVFLHSERVADDQVSLGAHRRFLPSEIAAITWADLDDLPPLQGECWDALSNATVGAAIDRLRSN